MKKFCSLLLLFIVFIGKQQLLAQVSVTASNGTGTYTTLRAAFDAINAGTLKGDIFIDISASTNEGTTPATLNGGDADPTNYNFVFIQPVADGVTIAGNPGAGYGVIQLNGADNVIFSGDNPNSAGTNRDLTISNTSAAAAAYTSVIRIATRPTVITGADNNFILNCILTGNVTSGNASGITGTGSSSNTSFGIYCGGNAGTTSALAPAAITSETTNPAAAGTTIDNLVIDNNQINQCGRGIAFNGAATSVATSLTITNNIIGAAGGLGAYPFTTPASTVYSKGIWVAGTAGVYINNNTIRNILSYLGTSVTAIELNSAIGSSLIEISSNTITGVANNSATNDAFGILVNSVSNKFSITGNTIATVQNNATASVAGIKIATAGGQASITQNKVSGVFSRNTGGYGAFGIQLASAAAGAEISNNFVFDIMNYGSASFNNTDNAAGIIIASGSNHKIYHNSVSLYGNNAGPGSNLMSCLHVTSSAIAGLDIRNNIFSNTVTSAGASDALVCMYFPFNAAGMGYTLNNNAYYTGATVGKHGIAQVISTSYNAANIFDGAAFNSLATSPASNFRSYSSAMGNTSNDFASFATSAAAPFTSATDLHIPAATSTRLESGAVPVGILSDIDNAARSGSAPDIGADEFIGTPQDLTPPLITYTALTGTCNLTARTLTATITDASGVGTAANLPRLWWKINAGAYVLAPAPTVAGNNYTFTFGAGVIVGDIVSYYIVAQDNAATPNVIAESSVGAGPYTANPPASATAPTSPDSYAVQNNLAPGTYTVGGAGVYPTLTAAVNAYNNSCLSGAVIFTLLDATYPSETYPIVIGNPAASATNTLTIKPAPAVNATISGISAGAIIKLNGADYVTIDGSNAGSGSQNLTIINTDAGTSSSIIWVASASSANPATHNTIKNLIVSGNTNTTTFAGIISSSGTTVGAVAEAANSNNTYLNNNISTAVYGLVVVGNGSGDNATVITNNKIGSGTAANKISFIGMFVSNQTGVLVNGNNIAGITSNQGSNTNVTAGITVRGAISGGNIHSNTINDINNYNTGAWTAHGITLQSSSLTSNLTVYNNFIYDITGDGYTPNVTDNGHGIGILSGGGYNVYYNSIQLNTDPITAGNSAAIFIDNRAAAGGTPVNLNIRNNIFSNQQSAAAGTRYAIYSAAPASSFTDINYNDYYTTGTPLGFLGSGRANLAAWQSATGADGNSISVDPVFISPTAPVNLHLKITSPSSTLDGQATPIAGITVDIDGNGRNVTTPDMGADEFTPNACNLSGVITAGTVTATQTTVCVSAAVVFASTAFSTGSGMTYQWESSPDNALWSAIAGETNPSGVSITVSTTTYYRLSVTCTITSTTALSNVILVTVNNPTITASTGGTVCGLGTVNLSATGSAGTTVYWYNALTGGNPLSSGSAFVTPSINATTTYYAEAVSGATLGAVGPVSPSTIGTGIGTQTISWEVYFDVIQATTLLSVDVYPINSGQSSTLNVYNSANTIIATIPYTTTVSGGATAQTIPINLALPVATGYYLYAPGGLPSGGATRNTSGAVYPYTSSAINITGNEFDQSYFMCYYNFQYSSGCPSSPRTPIVATVTAPPAYTAPVASAPVVCEGGSSNLTGFDADYTSYTWVPALGLSNAAIANPVATPAATTTYTVTVNNGTCTTSGDVTITVNPVPGALAISPASPAVCAGATQMLTATGGSGNFFRERFEAFPISKFAVTGTNLIENQSTTYYQEGSKSVLLTYADFMDISQPNAYEMTNNIDLSLYSSSVLTFQHICATEGNGSSDWDFGYVEYSTDGGTNWTTFPASSYTGSGALRNGVVSFDKTSYADWSAQFTGSGSNPGAGPATALWKLETIDLTPWQASTQFKVRFRIKSDGSVVYYGWLLDDIKINGQASITWGPVTELYTNAGATLAYAALTNHPVVYVKPTATRLYTATASFGTCSTTATVTPTVTANNISISITTPTTTVCASYPVDFSISAQNIQGSPTPFYDWKINGVTASGSATGASSVGTIVTVASTANLHVGMRVSVTAGTGAFQGNTRIVSITNATQFVVSVNPILALSGATISAVASGGTVTSFSYTGLITGDVVTCVLTVGGVACVVPLSGSVTSNSLTFTVNPTTPASVSVAAVPAGPICAGTSVTFTATPTNGGAAPTYEWFIGGVSQGAASPVTTFSSSTLVNGDVVTCKMVSNAVNCPFPNPSTSAAITMTVNPSFPVSVSISANPGVNICSGTPVTFTAVPTNGGVTPLYEWFVNGISQGAPSGVATFSSNTLVDLDVVTCVLTSSIASCATGNPATSNPLNISVTVQTATVALSPLTAVCAGGGPVVYTATPTNGGASPTYEWFVGGVSQGAPSVVATFSHTPVNGEVIRVDMVSSLSCALPVPATASYSQVVNANPTANITGSNILCSGIPVVLNSNAVAGSGTITTIQWRVGGSNIAGANNALYVAPVIGSYDVVITNSNLCTITSPAFVVSAAPVLMSGVYTIGAITATGASSAGATITVASTANLVAGAALTKISGVGTFAANTVITNIIDGTTFTVNAAPTVALSGAVIAGATCTNYISFAAAISDLNSRSINGNCTFNVTPGYIENTAAQLALGNATLNAAAASRTITFQKNGAGVNPRINAAYAGVGSPASAAPDGIWSLNGIDNVTIDGIDLNDNNSANVTVTMEFGFGLFKLSNTDGAQNNTIKNSTVTLNRVNVTSGNAPLPSGSTGILVINSTRIAATTALAAGGAVGANSGNKFYTNTIQNCNNGIVLNGLTDVTPFTNADFNNDIGGAALATGNTILNFGGGAGALVQAAGVIASSQWGVNISYNTINNNNGSGVNHVNTLVGILGQAAVSASATINNNTVTVNGGGTTTAVTAISNGLGATPAAANTISISNNIISGSYTTATTGVWTGITNAGVPTTMNMNGNTVQNVTLAGTGAFTGITNTPATTGALNINGNTITGNTKSSTGTMSLITIGGLGAAAVLNANTNVITNNTVTGGAAACTLNGITSGLTASAIASTYNGNTISNNSITAMTGALVATINGILTNLTGASNETISNNSINNLYITSGVGGSTGAHVLRGISTSAGGTKTIATNTINNLYTNAATSAAVTAIQNTGGTTVAISRNYVYNLFPGQSSAASSAKGILVSSGTTITATNNVVALDLTLATLPAANAVLTGSNAVIGLEVAGGTTVNAYYNSINLVGAGSGTVFGSSAISQTSIAPTLDTRDNIFNNTMTPGGTSPGFTVAFRRAAVVSATYSVNANYNAFYAGAPAAGRYLYFDGTTGYTTIQAYRTGVAGGREAASNDLPTTFTSSINLLPTAANCSNDGAGNNTGTGITVDYTNAARSPIPVTDIGAYEFTSSNTTSIVVNTPAALCTGSTVDLTLPAVTLGSSAGAIFRYYTDAAGTILMSVPPATAVNASGTYYIRAYLGSCSSPVTPVVVTINPNNTWLGINTDWNDTQNWCPGVPGAATDVTIPAAVANYPVIISGSTADARNVTIAAGASVTTTGTGILNVRGNLVNNGTLANWGEIRMTGAVAQTLPGSGTVAAMNKLTIANTSGANPAVTVNNNLLIREVITPTTGIINLNNSYITLRSVVDSTARVGTVGTGSFTYTGTGNFVVERYYPGRRTWRLITAPIIKTNARTIFSSWQVGGNNSLGGSGTYVSGIGANPATNGLDITATSSSSLKVFNYVNSALNPLLNTKTSRIAGFTAGGSALADTTGYFMFIRGDRTAANVNAFNPSGPVLETTLRDTGNIITGAYTFTCNPNIGANKYTLIGNPYASPVDFAGLTKSNILDKFWAWDPNLNAVGGYVTLAGLSGYAPVKSPLTSTGTVAQTQIIQSSQAILVETIAAGPASLTFNEGNKSDTNNLSVFRPVANPVTTMASNIFIVGTDGVEKLADGAVTQFGADYSQAIDGLDAAKFSNINENFGIVSNGTTLSIERRKIPTENDTLFYAFTRTGQKNYRFNVYMQNFVLDNNLTPFLQDTYLNKLSSINTDGDTWVDFSVTADAASADRNRFRIVFKKLVQYTGIGAEVLNSDVAVNWNVSSEFNIHHYEVERSSNGTSFESAGSQLSSGNTASGKNYSLLDLNPAPGVYYYRIKCIGNNGAIAYSDKVKVTVIKGSPAMFVFPNPVTNNVIGLQMNKMQGGVYETVLMSEDGKVINRNRIVHANGTSTESIKPALNLISGSYRLEVVGPDKKVTTLNIIVQTK